MSFRFRERWTESDVISLPAGEHDYFDRKRGELLTHSVDTLKRELGKAVSAFANSGGGHLLIGVRDDGAFDGVDPRHGNTSTRQWLEQLLPNLVSYPLRDFRVHEVEPSTPSEIPTNKVLVVVDIDDSPHAPHQDSASRLYYVRFGSHSVAAPHYILDALRRRVVAPKLDVVLEDLEPRCTLQNRLGVLAHFGLRFRVTNAGKIAARRWKVGVELKNGFARSEDLILNRRAAILLHNTLHRAPDTPILPSDSVIERHALAVQLRTVDFSEAGLDSGLRDFLAENPVLRVRVYSEGPPDDGQELELRKFMRPGLASILHWLMPGSHQDVGKEYAGHDFWYQWLHQGQREASGLLINSSDATFAETRFIARMFNQVGDIIWSENFRLEHLPAGERRSFDVRLWDVDLSSRGRLEVCYLGGRGRRANGSLIFLPVDGVLDG